MTGSEAPRHDPPIACDLDVLTPPQRERHGTLLETLRGDVLETRELENGYALRFGTDSATIRSLAEWMTLERACCPFLGFSIRLERGDGPVWLDLTGSPEAKAYIGAVLLSRPA